MKVCVLGLGNMGLPVAINLARAGHDVTGANIAPVPAASEAGVAVSTDATEALRDREVVFCLLPDLPYLEPMLPALLDGGATDLVTNWDASPIFVDGNANVVNAQTGSVVIDPGEEVISAFRIDVSDGSQGTTGTLRYTAVATVQ